MNVSPRYTTVDGGGASIPLHREKVKLRLWTFRLWRQQTVLDLFAGFGTLSEEYARAGCDRLICVEKDPEYFRALQERMRPYPNVDLHNITFVDFDAFGCPNHQIQQFFKHHPLTRDIIVNVTNGMIFRLKRYPSVHIDRHYLVNVPKEEAVEAKEHHIARLLPWLQEQFIHILALKHGFNTAFLYHAMNLAANVTYYGFIAYPETEVRPRWATGKTPIIKYKDPKLLPIRSLLKQRKHN
ncbi:MAG: hypothetical protein ACE5Z5_04680 [Candidatus Bathyarchaeia archaeon]